MVQKIDAGPIFLEHPKLYNIHSATSPILWFIELFLIHKQIRYVMFKMPSHQVLTQGLEVSGFWIDSLFVF